VGALLLSLSVADVAAAEPLKIRYSVWVATGPFLAQERGYFEEEKADVQLNPSGSARPRGSRVDSPDEVP
jgi:ABC-type nitrate/sulfonate/bicarbonate transport system substrate-binding protein